MKKLADYIAANYRVKSDFCRKNNISKQLLNFWLKEGHVVEQSSGADGRPMIRVISSKTDKVLAFMGG